MREARQAMVGVGGRGLPGALPWVLLGVLLGMPPGAPPAAAGGLDCTSQWLNRTEQAICADPQLLRLDEQVARRLQSFAARLNFGQYLGLRHWHAMQARQRAFCMADRDCIAAGFKAQSRFLDRLQRCVGSNLARRACLREALAGEPEGSRR
jgi:uncharacterized protein